MITNIYFSEEYIVDDSGGYYYKYITVEGTEIYSYGSYYHYQNSFNLSCCVSRDFSGLEPDIDSDFTYNVIGRWLNTDEATKSFELSTLRCMYFESIFTSFNNESNRD